MGTFKLVIGTEKKMQQKISIWFLNVIVLYCGLVQSEKFPIISKTSIKHNVTRQNPDIWDLSACGMRTIPDLRSMQPAAAETTVGKWPWVASIHYRDPSDNGQPKHYGTATIITDRHLITVAQVFTSRNSSKAIPTDFFVVVGGEFGGQGLLYDIQDIYKYNANQGAMSGGLAIVRLLNAMTLTDYVRPICLPRMEDIDHSHENKSLIEVGWGYSSNNFSETQVLYEVRVPVLPEEVCQQYIPGTYPTDKLICGAQSKETTCKFDNGGPLMTSKDGKFTVVGLTDKAIGRKLQCGKTEIPIYFIKVVPYMKWIRDIILNSWNN